MALPQQGTETIVYEQKKTLLQNIVLMALPQQGTETIRFAINLAFIVC